MALKKTTKKASAVTQNELAEFKRLHVEVELANEKMAHEQTQAQLQQSQLELRALHLSLERQSVTRARDAKLRERKNDLQAAKDAASGFAKHLSDAYSVSLKAHAICPLTGEFIALSETADGQS